MSKYICSHESLTRTLPQNYTEIIPNARIDSDIILWHLVDLTDDMSRYKVILAFMQAFQEWEPHFAPIKFKSTSDPNEAHILINFAHPGDEDLPIPFDDGVLAYAYAPINNKTQMWINDVYQWSEMHSPTEIFLKAVIVHELGHCFNLGHTDYDGDIMEPYYNPNGIITRDSINGINALYGDIKDRIRNRDEEETPPPEGEEGNDMYEFLKLLYPKRTCTARLKKHQLRTIFDKMGLSYETSDRKSVLLLRFNEYLGL